MEKGKTTGTLTEILRGTSPESVSEYFSDNGASLINGEKPFAEFVRKVLKEKSISQQQVFLSADISEGYGYKLISGEKHTVRRDIILRICFAGKFTLDEAQKALTLYGFAPLYPKLRRDAVLIIAFNFGIYDVFAVDELLINHGFEPLKTCLSVE